MEMGSTTIQQKSQSLSKCYNSLSKQRSSSHDAVGLPASNKNAKRVSINPALSSKASKQAGRKQQQHASSELETVFPGYTTPWSKKLILTLDGGGVLAYSSLIVLKALMNRIRDIEQNQTPRADSSANSPLFDYEFNNKYIQNNVYLPCHYFDYIAGTSIGGSIAIMLGHYRMSVDDCIQQFNARDGSDLEPPIDINHFGRKSRSSPTPSWSSSESEKLYRSSIGVELELTFTDMKQREFKMDPWQCKTLAICAQVSKDHTMEEPYIFCSYDLPIDRAEPIKVFDVARAITTNPSFEPYMEQYRDGSLHAYNPSYQVYKEVSALQSAGKDAIDLLLSLGTSTTGIDALRKLGVKSFYHLFMLNKESLISKESRRQEVDSELRKEGINYCRLQVPNVLPRRGKHVLPQIEKATNRYLQRPDVCHRLNFHAEMLVRKRRARAETGFWESFAFEIQYRCYVEDCLHYGEDFSDREEFFNHLIKAKHVKQPPASTEDEIRAALDKGRRI